MFRKRQSRIGNTLNLIVPVLHPLSACIFIKRLINCVSVRCTASESRTFIHCKISPVMSRCHPNNLPSASTSSFPNIKPLAIVPALCRTTGIHYITNRLSDANSARNLYLTLSKPHPRFHNFESPQPHNIIICPPTIIVAPKLTQWINFPPTSHPHPSSQPHSHPLLKPPPLKPPPLKPPPLKPPPFKSPTLKTQLSHPTLHPTNNSSFSPAYTTTTSLALQAKHSAQQKSNAQTLAARTMFEMPWINISPC